MTERPTLTDFIALSQHRKRAAQNPQDRFFWEYLAEEVKDRLSLVQREFTKLAVITGAPEFWQSVFPDADMIMDQERLEFPQKDYDLVLDLMTLHWSNDPIGQMIQTRYALKPDSYYLAAFAGGESLHELREALMRAETQLLGGASPRCAPMIDIRSAGALLQRSGFALPVADLWRLDLRYSSLARLCSDLRMHGENNAQAARLKRPTPKALFEKANDIYQANHSDTEGKLFATLDVIVMTAWAPHPDQPKALRPGTATHLLSDVLERGMRNDEN